jgi:UDP-2,3-diacylglucosamine pyrophosphatase LpxH
MAGKTRRAAYGFLTIINKLTNQILKHFGIKEVIFYKSMKDRILKDKTTLTKFEQTLARMAAFRNYQTVICGHTHIPVDKVLSSDKGPVRYLNCGDWLSTLPQPNTITTMEPALL